MVVGGQCGLGHATTTVVTKFPAPPPVFISNACRVSEASEAHPLFCHQFEALDSFDILLPFIHSENKIVHFWCTCNSEASALKPFFFFCSLGL